MTLTLSPVSPSSTPYGADFTLTLTTTNVGGMQFYSTGDYAVVGGHSIALTYVSNSTATCIVPGAYTPAPGGSLDVYWQSTNLSDISSTQYISITTPTPPTLSSISPTSSVINTGSITLTVNGANFRAGGHVFWDNVAYTPTFINSSQVQVSVPTAGAARVVAVYYTDESYTATSTLYFNLTNPVGGGGGGGGNTAPNAPTLTTRSNFASNGAANFYWTFSDPDTSDAQTAYQLIIERVSDSAVIYDSGKVVSSVSSKALAASTLTAAVAYRWKVRTWDTSDAVSVYSSYGTFTTFTGPTATITAPATNGATVTSGAVTVSWTYSGASAQTAYQVVVTNTTSGALMSTTGKVLSVATSVAAAAALMTATNYRIDVTVWDTSDQASPVANRTFVTSFTPPMTPTISSITYSGLSPIASVVYSNPAPTGGASAVAFNELYRSSGPTGPWKRVRAALTPGASALDHGVPLDGSLVYFKVRAVAANGASSDSLVATSSYQGNALYLHAVSDPLGTGVALTGNIGPNDDALQFAAAPVQYQGRPRPAMEFGESESRVLRYPIRLVDARNELQPLLALIRRKEILCLRTRRRGQGEVVFGTITGFATSSTMLYRDATLEFIQVDYTDAV